MRSRMTALLLCALVATAAGCSKDQTPSTESGATQGKVGKIDLNLRLPSGTMLNALRYSISHSNGYANNGDVPLQNSTRARFQIGHIPAATGYSISVSGMTTTGDACTSSPASFEVQARQTSMVMLTLRCGGGAVASNNGNVRVDVDVLENPTCPEVDGLTAVPLEVIVGGSIALTGYGTTPAATFAWSVAPVAAGTFSAASAASTSFTCVTAGDATITLSVGGPAGCTPSTVTVPVSCTSDGSTAGSGGSQAGAGGAGSGGSGGSAAGTGGSAGAGTGGSAGAGTGGGGPSCATCRNANCRDILGVDMYAGCFEAINTGFGASETDPTFLQDCMDVVACAQQNDCAYDPTRETAECYCGKGRDNVQCQALGPVLPGQIDPATSAPYTDDKLAKCVTQWQRATRSTINSEVLGLFGELSLPSGFADFLLKCDAQRCNSAATGDCTVPQ